ncbi:hypothetical protein EDB86DRAFT_3243665 [Lactarius hatsudake]|nr:hypothetical protein EDB86DRAFT_3243665 [Lactarius hatsudake]
MSCMTFDQDPNVRIGGYKAIVRMSEEQPRWLQRNVDILVQLLQIDEPEEVVVIKMVLIQHLELDSKVTLGVLYDQIVPPDDPMEDEDKTIRECPEALVVVFLTQETWKPLAQLQGQRRGAAEQEDALIDTLIKVLGAISPSFLLGTDALAGSIQILCGGRGEDYRGHPRLLALIQRRTANMARERAGAPTYYSRAPPQRSGRMSPLGGTRRTWSSPAGTLSCRTFCTVQKHHRSGVVPALQLYVLSQGENVTRRLSQDSRMFFITRLIGTLAACSLQKGPESSELTSMRRLVVDTLSLIRFHPSTPSDAQAWGSCEILLETCQRVGD